MTKENITSGTAGEVNARFEAMMAKLRAGNEEIRPLKPEAQRLRPAVTRAEVTMFEAGAELDKIFAAHDPDIERAFEVLGRIEAAVDELIAEVEVERSRDVGPMGVN